MAKPTLSPASTTSAVVLTSTGSIAITGNGAGNPTHYPFGIYVDADSALYDANFVNGASDQVAFTYKKLGGDILDIELTPGNIYASYEEALLEYSYQINTHQAKNVLSDFLGASTGTFDHDGQMIGGDAKDSAANLKFPRFEINYTKKVADAMSGEANIGGNLHEYSASFLMVSGQQDYDLQNLISASAAPGGTDPATGDTPTFTELIGNKKITIRRVWYKTTRAIWRFYGYYGGVSVVGNFQTYGQFADDSSFEIIPTWQNKMQAMAYEDNIYTRTSHYSYEIHNNNLRIFPIPDTTGAPTHFWVSFNIQKDPWEDYSDMTDKMDGVNNLNTMPFDNIPYANINSIGKQWIRRFALALSKETLGQIRSKFSTIPIPGETITLNGSALITEGKEEQTKLREELKATLDELTYNKLSEVDAAVVENAGKILSNSPMKIFVG